MSLKRVSMRISPVRAGFTLLEVLIAAAIMAGIVSMVYSSFFAVVKSSEVCQARIDISGQARQVLRQLARQIRCAYVPGPSYVKKSVKVNGKSIPGIVSIAPEERVLSEDASDYFSGGAGRSTPDLIGGGEILHLVSTGSFTNSPEQANGLFEAAYRFDANKGVLFLSEQRFVQDKNAGSFAMPSMSTRDDVWQQILSGVRDFKLEYFDGEKWFDEWDFKKRHEPPCAAKIVIDCEDERGRLYEFATTAVINCRKNGVRSVNLPERIDRL